MKEIFPLTGRGLVIGITARPARASRRWMINLRCTIVGRASASHCCCRSFESFSGGAILGDRIRMQTLGPIAEFSFDRWATRGNLVAWLVHGRCCFNTRSGGYGNHYRDRGRRQDEVEVVKAADISVVVWFRHGR